MTRVGMPTLSEIKRMEKAKKKRQDKKKSRMRPGFLQAKEAERDMETTVQQILHAATAIASILPDHHDATTDHRIKTPRTLEDAILNIQYLMGHYKWLLEEREKYMALLEIANALYACCDPKSPRTHIPIVGIHGACAEECDICNVRTAWKRKVEEFAVQVQGREPEKTSGIIVVGGR